MSAVDYHLINEEINDDSLNKRDFIKIYHQSGANVDSEISSIKLNFGKKT